MSEEEKFFSKKHLIAAGWAALFAIIGYCVHSVEEALRGPQRVAVTNLPAPAPATIPPIVNATAQLDADTALQLRKMMASVERSMRQQQNIAASASDADREAAEKRISDLEQKIAQLQVIEARSKTSLTANSSSAAKSSAALDTIDKTKWPYTAYAKVLYPIEDGQRFTLPEKAKGYSLQQKSKLLLNVTCPSEKTVPRISNVRVSFSVRDDQTLARMSPLWIQIARQDSAEEFTLYFSSSVAIRRGGNVIELGTNFEPGRHLLRIGYFLNSELSREYPMYYIHDCYLDAV